MRTVAKQILVHNNDSTLVYNQVERLDFGTYRVNINDTLHPDYLESLIRYEFDKQGIKSNFEYSIYDCFFDSVLYTKGVYYESPQELIDENAVDNSIWNKESHSFSIYFPDIETQLITEMDFWMVSTIILFAVFIFFAYIIFVILQQKKLSEIKTDFINNMTHELKTPISTIKLSSEAIMKPENQRNPERLEKYAGIIFQENNRLRQLVERVLQIGTLDKQTVKLKLTTVKITALIQRSIESLDLTLKEKGGSIKLAIQLDDDQVELDEVHMTNVFCNLIDNAIKYNNKAPEITITVVRVKKGVSIEFCDNGIGIKKEDQKYIFEKLYRVPKGNQHDVKGFGLGLFYVKMMIGAHKGTVSVVSNLGKGSCFKITLPVRQNQGMF